MRLQIGEEMKGANFTAPLSRAASVAACWCTLLAVAGPVAAYQQQMQTAAERLGAAMTKTGKSAVAVVDFTDLQGNATELGRFLAEQLSVALGAGGASFEVIDRNHLRALLQEHKLSATGLIDPQTARKVGQMVGAECLATGSITPFSESVNLSIKLLDTNTARIVGAVTLDIPRTSTINELLAKGISGGLISTGQPAAASPATPPSAASEEPALEIDPVEVYGILVSLLGCKAASGEVACTFSLENTANGDIGVVLPRSTITFGGAAGPPAGVLYDRSGNDYPSSRVRLGARQGADRSSSRVAVGGYSGRAASGGSGTASYNLPSGISIAGSITFPRVPQETTRCDVVLSVGVGRGGKNVTFQDIPIGR